MNTKQSHTPKQTALSQTITREDGANIIELLQEIAACLGAIVDDVAQIQADHDPDKFRYQTFTGIAPVVKRGGRNG